MLWVDKELGHFDSQRHGAETTHQEPQELRKNSHSTPWRHGETLHCENRLGEGKTTKKANKTGSKSIDGTAFSLTQSTVGCVSKINQSEEPLNKQTPPRDMNKAKIKRRSGGGKKPKHLNSPKKRETLPPSKKGGLSIRKSQTQKNNLPKAKTGGGRVATI